MVRYPIEFHLVMPQKIVFKWTGKEKLLVNKVFKETMGDAANFLEEAIGRSDMEVNVGEYDAANGYVCVYWNPVYDNDGNLKRWFRRFVFLTGSKNHYRTMLRALANGETVMLFDM